MRARGDARGDARTQAQASSSAAASSSSTAAPHQHGVPSLALSDVVAAGRAALAGAAAEVQACVPQPWSYAYIRRAALVHSHSTGNPRKGAHRRRPSEFVVTNAMREQSARNLFDSETLGLQREAFYTQRQLAMHSLRDRAQARIDYNQGLAEGAAGMADMGGGDDSFTALAEAANARAMQAEATMERRLIDSARQMPAV